MTTCRRGHDLESEGRARIQYDRRYGKSYVGRECVACAREARARRTRVVTYSVPVATPDPYWERFTANIDLWIEHIRRTEGFDSRLPARLGRTG